MSSGRGVDDRAPGRPGITGRLATLSGADEVALCALVHERVPGVRRRRSSAGAIQPMLALSTRMWTPPLRWRRFESRQRPSLLLLRRARSPARGAHQVLADVHHLRLVRMTYLILNVKEYVATTFAPEFQPRSQPGNRINAHLVRLYPAQTHIKPVPRGHLPVPRGTCRAGVGASRAGSARRTSSGAARSPQPAPPARP